jgi:hypothetical protein
VAKVIKFYIPNNFRKPIKRTHCWRGPEGKATPAHLLWLRMPK